jgi:hypothetical protein
MTETKSHITSRRSIAVLGAIAAVLMALAFSSNASAAGVPIKTTTCSGATGSGCNIAFSFPGQPNGFTCYVSSTANGAAPYAYHTTFVDQQNGRQSSGWSTGQYQVAGAGGWCFGGGNTRFEGVAQQGSSSSRSYLVILYSGTP